MTNEQYPEISEMDANDGLDRVIVPTPRVDQEERRSLLRRTSSPVVTFVAGTLATLGAAEKADYARGADPMNAALAAMTPASTLAPQGVDTPVSTARVEIERWKNQIKGERLKVTYSNVEKAVGVQDQVTKRIELLMRLKAQLKTSMSDEETMAIQELCYEEAKLCGSFNDALDLHYKIDSRKDPLDQAYIREEVDFLTKAVPLSVNQFASKQTAISSALKERADVLAALETLKTNPNDEKAHMVLGVYLLFGRYDSDAAFAHFAAGSDPVMRELSQPANLTNPEIWEAGVQKVRPEWKKQVAARAAKIREVHDSIATGGLPRVTAASSQTPVEIAVAPTDSSASPSAPKTAVNAAEAKGGRKIDIMQGFRASPLKQLTLNGKSMIDPATGRLLFGAGVEKGTARMIIPMVPTGDYSLHIEMTEEGPEHAFTFVLPAGKGEIVVNRIPGKLSLEQNDGNLLRVHPVKIDFDMPPNGKATFDIDVDEKQEGGENSYTVTVNVAGKKLEHTFKEVAIPADKKWYLDTQSLGIWSWGTNTSFEKFTATLKGGVRQPQFKK